MWYGTLFLTYIQKLMFEYFSMQATRVTRGGTMGGGGGKGAKAPLKISKKGKMKKYDVFSGIKVIKISFSVIFNEEIRALEGLLSWF